jgi:superfamily I DNA/RNA helicase
LNGFSPNTKQTWSDLISYFGLDGEHEEQAIEVAAEVYEKSLSEAKRILGGRAGGAKETLELDFDDMLLFACLPAVNFRRADVLFVDEAQDTNGVQIFLMSKMLAEAGRLVAVGDSHQAIYGFRGAGSDSMKLVAEKFNCVQLPLTVSWRCGKSIIREAQKIVAHIEAAPNARDGKVEKLESFDASIFEPSDAVLCRTNKPLVSLAFSLTKAKRIISFADKDMGGQVVAVLKSRKAKSVAELEAKLRAFHAKKSAALADEGKAVALAAFEDKMGCVFEFFKNTRANTTDALIEEVKSFFAESASAAKIELSTVHKAKGKEYQRVFILGYSELMPLRYAKLPWQKEQEENLRYVAITRAKEYLGYLKLTGYDCDKAKETKKASAQIDNNAQKDAQPPNSFQLDYTENAKSKKKRKRRNSGRP